MPTTIKIQSRPVAIAILCLAGAGLSIASLRSHYTASATEYCDLNALFNCDIVNRSKYSELFGIPVALIGMLGYLALLGLTTRTTRSFELLRFYASFVGLVFGLYLAYIEEFVLQTWCLLCIGSLICIAGVTIISATELLRSGTKQQTGRTTP